MAVYLNEFTRGTDDSKMIDAFKSIVGHKISLVNRLNYLLPIYFFSTCLHLKLKS